MREIFPTQSIDNQSQNGSFLNTALLINHHPTISNAISRLNIYTAMKNKIALYLAISIISLRVTAQNISTVAGTGTTGYSGDGAAATAAQLNGPMSIAVDAGGNIYFADRNNFVVRKINTSGMITTIAGNHANAWSGDNGPATDAAISDITGVATDAAGNVYIADKSNNRIRKVDAAGIITTIAGTGTAGFAGDNAPATDALLNTPRGVATDAAGNVYIGDVGNQRIRKISTMGIITTVAGTGTAGYNGDHIPATDAQLHGPYNVAINAAGELYIADVDNQSIRKVATDGTITTVAGTGTAGYSGDGSAATAAALTEPISVATDPAGNLYIADAWNFRVRKVNPAGIINTVAGNGVAGFAGDGVPAVIAQLNDPYGIAVAAGSLYIADFNNNRIRAVAQVNSVNSVDPSSVQLSISPNPAAEFGVRLSTLQNEEAVLTLSDLSGATCLQIKCSTNKTVTVKPNGPPGIYFISVTTSHNAEKAAVILAY
jgi:hypothetical protein